MGKTGGWYKDSPVPDKEWIYHPMSSAGNRNPRTTTFPRPVPDEVACDPSRALIAQRRRVREQLVTYTTMADALEFMEYKQSTPKDRELRRLYPWINMDDGDAMDRVNNLGQCLPSDDSAMWDAARDDHNVPRYPRIIPRLSLKLKRARE